MTDYKMAAPECHFITVAEMRADYDSQLSRYFKETGARNVIVSMEVEMSVGNAAPQSYAAALAISYDYGDVDELISLSSSIFGKSKPFAFGWVPADLYGTDKFGIFIEQGSLGDKLANGLIDDIIQTIQVEEAVING